jgi:hypothetical protein
MIRSGRKRDDAFEVDLRVTADACNRGCRRRVITVLDTADDALAGTGGKQRFGQVRCQADDALRRLREAQPGPDIIDHLDRRRRRVQQTDATQQANGKSEPQARSGHIRQPR